MAMQDVIEKLNREVRLEKPNAKVSDHDDREFRKIRALFNEGDFYSARFARSNIREVDFVKGKSMLVVMFDGKEYRFFNTLASTFRKLIAHPVPDKYLNKLFYTTPHVRVKRGARKIVDDEEEVIV